MINSLVGKKGKLTYINKLNMGNNCVTDPKLIAESINDYFINVGLDLAADRPSHTHRETNSEQVYGLNENCDTTANFCVSEF